MGSSRPYTPRLAEKLCEIRARLGLSQAQMVERLKNQTLPSPLKLYAGNISRFEQGLREPPLLVLLAYARSVGVAVEVLIDAELELPGGITGKPKKTRKERVTEEIRKKSLLG